MATKKLEVLITGNARGAVSAMKQAEGGAGGMGSKFAKVGKAVGAAFAIAGVAAVGFAVKSAHTFATVGGEVLRLQRFTGLGAEAASKLRFSLQQSGVDAMKASKSFGIFNKNLAAGKLDGGIAYLKAVAKQTKDVAADQLRLSAARQHLSDIDATATAKGKATIAFQITHRKALAAVTIATQKLTLASKPLSKAVFDLGFKTRDAHGKLLPFDKILGSVADKFASMKAGPAKVALAMKLFGKAGADMIPFLNKGSKGLAALAAEAKKYGLVLTKDNLVAVKKSIVAHRQQTAAMQGLQVQIGMHVLPILTRLTTWFATTIPKITAFVEKNKWLGKVVLGVVVVAFAAWAASAATAAAATLAATWPILAVVAGLALLVVGLKYAYNHWGWFRKAVDASVRYLRNVAWPLIKQFTADIASEFGKLVGFIRQHWSQISAVIHFYIAGFQLEFRILKAALSDIGTVLSWLYNNVWRPTWAQISTATSVAWSVIHPILGYISESVGGVDGVINSVGDTWISVWGGIHHAVTVAWGIIEPIVSKIKSAVGGISGAISTIGGALSHVPGFASGTRSAPGGVALVGERGPELVNLPRGAQVHTASDTRAMARHLRGNNGGGGGGDINIYVAGTVVTVRQLVDELRSAMIQKQRQTGRPFIPAPT